MENLIQTISDNFNFGLIISINVLVYLIVKSIDSICPKHSTPKWTKMLTTVIVSVVLGILYSLYGGLEFTTILNSCICATVIWDWILKPILHKFKIDYGSN